MQRKWKRRWQRLANNIFPPLAAGLLFLSAYSPALANPAGGTVVSGNAAITTSGSTTTINQTSQKAILNWQSFSIGKGETVNFLQPSASAVALNRVIGSDASSIYGTLSANGKVFLINPNGILFAPGSQVSTGGLVASTLNISDSDFMNGNLTFSGSGTGQVANQGTIIAANEAVFIGPQVTNEGVIAAKVTGLAAGNKVSLDFSGDNLLNITVDTQAAGGKVTNSGTITATGGTVIMSAGTKNTLLGTVVNNSGVIRAQSVSNVNGVIRLEGGTVVSSGTLDASGKASGQTGGTVKVLGDAVTLKAGSTVDVSGDQGGGTALIGGAYQGGTSEYAATRTTVEQGAVITADALTQGSGGQVVVWANDTTKFAGTITARGGSQSGNGGSVEVSGKNTLLYQGHTDTTAPKGRTGSLLLDPGEYTISTEATGDNVKNADELANQLGSTNITLTTDGTGTGDITVNSNLTWTSANTLTLSAHNNISINAAIAAPNGGLTLAAGTASNGDGVITPASGSCISVGTFTLESGTWWESASTLSSFSAENFHLSSGTFLRALGGDGSSDNPFQIADVYGLQGIGSAGMLGNSYTLANNINASGTANWNSNAGFAPIGTYDNAFTGTFDGQSHTITGLTVNRPSADYVGLFGITGGSIRNVGLTGGNVTGRSYAGGLVGENDGTISNAYSSGSVTGFSYVGGLVGTNGGTISNAYSSSPVLGVFDAVGGLVGTNGGTISNAYSSGPVLGSSANTVGGLVGTNSGTISNAYSTSMVLGSYTVGGLVGTNSGTIGSAYWDVDTSTQPIGIGLDNSNQLANVTGLSTAAMKKLGSFSAWGNTISATGGANTVWRIYDGYSYPLLRSFLAPVTVTSVSKTYDGQTSGTASSYTLSNPNASPLGSLSYTTGSKNAGTYSTAADTLTLSGLYSNQQGYDISYAPATLTISKAALSVAANNAAKTYDGTAYSGGNSITYAGFVNGETAVTSNLTGTLTYGGTSQTARNAGSYTITPGGLSSGNYDISYTSGILTINPRSVVLSGSRTSDGSNIISASGLSVGNLVSGDSLSLSGFAILDSKDPGTRTISNTASLSLDNPNYTLSGATGTVIISSPPSPPPPPSSYAGTTGSILASAGGSLAGASLLTTFITNTGGFGSFANSDLLTLVSSFPPPPPVQLSPQQIQQLYLGQPPQQPGQPEQRPGQQQERPERPGQKQERPERPGQRPERPEQRQERPERPGQRPERPEQRQERPEPQERPGQQPRQPQQPQQSSGNTGTRSSDDGTGTVPTPPPLLNPVSP